MLLTDDFMVAMIVYVQNVDNFFLTQSFSSIVQKRKWYSFKSNTNSNSISQKQKR